MKGVERPGGSKKLRDPGEDAEREAGISRDREEGAEKPSGSKRKLGPEGTGGKATQEPWGPGKRLGSWGMGVVYRLKVKPLLLRQPWKNQ